MKNTKSRFEEFQKSSAQGSKILFEGWVSDPDYKILRTALPSWIPLNSVV
jgi:hypothetical protein